MRELSELSPDRRWSIVVWFALSGCGLFYRAPAPIPAIGYSAAGGPAGHDLLILLPGRSDRATTFADEGIVALAQRSVPGIDVTAVDATVGYYIHRNLTQRLLADVVEPAQARGYRSIWISGISMGGLGALLFAQRHPDVVADVIAIAPFLGDEPIIDEIERAGGLAAWQPPATLAADDYQRDLWRWLKACTEHRRSCPRIYLGFGAQDRFVRAERLLAAALPAGQVAVVPGEHTWAPWRQLYATLLTRVPR